MVPLLQTLTNFEPLGPPIFMYLYKSESIQLQKFRASMKIYDLQVVELNQNNYIYQFIA